MPQTAEQFFLKTLIQFLPQTAEHFFLKTPVQFASQTAEQFFLKTPVQFLPQTPEQIFLKTLVPLLPQTAEQLFSQSAHTVFAPNGSSACNASLTQIKRLTCFQRASSDCPKRMNSICFCTTGTSNPSWPDVLLAKRCEFTSGAVEAPAGVALPRSYLAEAP